MTASVVKQFERYLRSHGIASQVLACGCFVSGVHDEENRMYLNSFVHGHNQECNILLRLEKQWTISDETYPAEYNSFIKTNRSIRMLLVGDSQNRSNIL